MSQEQGGWKRRLGEGLKGLSYIHLAIALGAFALGYPLLGDIETLSAGGHYLAGNWLSKRDEKQARVASNVGHAALAGA